MEFPITKVPAAQLQLHHLVRCARGWARLVAIDWSVDWVQLTGVDPGGVRWSRGFRRAELVEVITSAVARDIRRLAAQLPPEE